MFDISSYSPWLILALVGLILFRPDDWQDLAFYAGRWVRRARAYVLEWQEYLEFTDAGTKVVSKVPAPAESIVFHACDAMLWPSKGMGGRIISVPPNV